MNPLKVGQTPIIYWIITTSHWILKRNYFDERRNWRKSWTIGMIIGWNITRVRPFGWRRKWRGKWRWRNVNWKKIIALRKRWVYRVNFYAIRNIYNFLFLKFGFCQLLFLLLLFSNHLLPIFFFFNTPILWVTMAVYECCL